MLVTCQFSSIFYGSHVVQRGVQSQMIVIKPPLLYYYFCFIQVQKPVLVKAFVPQFSIETFYIAVLCRTTWVCKNMFNFVVMCPSVQNITGKF